MFFAKAKGYTNKLKTQHITNAKINAAAASVKPSIQNNNLTVNNQIIPSRSSEKISPGNLTKPHSDTPKNTSSTKLFCRNRQEINGNNTKEPTDAPTTMPVSN